MILRLLSAIAAALVLTTAPASAFDIDAMSADERAAFRAEVRNYLLENPEVLMEAFGILEARQAEEQAEAEVALIEDLGDQLFDDGVSWVGGNPDGDVTLVEFMDYRCGFCRRALDEVTQLIEFDGNIRLVLKEFPILGEESLLASRFAISTRNLAGADAYKLVHDRLLAHRGAINDAALTRIASDFDLDGAAILAGMDDAAITEELRANRALAQQLDISGTPTFVLENEMLRGYVPMAQMLDRVEAQRAD